MNNPLPITSASACSWPKAAKTAIEVMFSAGIQEMELQPGRYWTGSGIAEE